ncbi:hypothetical protein ACKFKG_22230 [Phormidesmis sp. 146-35]
MSRLTDQDLKAIQKILEWLMVSLLMPIGLFSISDDWLTGLSYIALAIILCPLTLGARWLKITIAIIVILICEL